LLGWLVLVEAGVEVWFRIHERRPASVAEWAFDWPVENASFKQVKLSEGVRAQMRADAEQAAAWQEADGSQWQVFYFRWLAARSVYSRVKVQLAKTHSPERCIPSAGISLRSDLGIGLLNVSPKLRIPFHKYAFISGGNVLHVFFAVVEDTELQGEPANLRRSHWQRLLAGLAGSRNYGQRSLEIGVTGYESAEQAEAAVTSQLQKLINGTTGQQDNGTTGL
jgi:hypothetical protein